jgi:hypothetical protein
MLLLLKFLPMSKKVFIPVLVVAIVAAVWFFFFNTKKPPVIDDKLPAIQVSQHTEAFNRSLEPVMNAYYAMAEGFVNWDTVSVGKAAHDLKWALDSLKIHEIEKDTLIYESALGSWDNMKVELAGMMAEPTIEKKREEFNMVSQNLYDFLRTIRYDEAKVYFQECPMAFDEDRPGNWLSKTPDVRNPYLGTKHPKYHDGMLTCGGPKDTINFINPDTPKK